MARSFRKLTTLCAKCAAAEVEKGSTITNIFFRRMSTTVQLAPETDSSAPLVPGNAVSTWKLIVEAGAVLGTLAFTAGWSYISSYLSTFGFRAFDVEISTSVASALAPHVLYRSTWPLIVLPAITLGFVGLHYFTGRSGRRSTTFALMLLGVAYVCMLWAGISSGRAAARQATMSDSNLPKVGLELLSQGSEKLPRCVAYGVPECRLLMHAKGNWYLLSPIASGTEPVTEVYNFHIYAVPESQVRMVYLVTGAK